MGRHTSYSNYLRRASDKAAVETIFNVLSFDAVSGRADVLRVEPRSRFFTSDSFTVRYL